MVVSWYALLYFLSSFAIILKRNRQLVAFFIVFRVSCYCVCPVALPHGAVVWSFVSNCGIS